MRRFVFCCLMALASLVIPAQAAPPTGRMVIAVICEDKDTTFKMADKVKLIRDSNNFSKNHIPIARVPATQLRPEDFQRIGFSRESLPVVALMKVSSSENLEGVWGNPPAIVRNVQAPEVAAQIILCRWAEYASVKLPPGLESVSQIYQPFRIFILNTAKDAETVRKTAEQLAKFKAAERITDKDLPVLSLVYGEGIMTAEDYTRLGFGPDALPAVGLVQMSDCGNPRAIVPDGALLRWSYSSSFVAREVLRQWAGLKNTSLKTIPASEPMSLDSLAWVASGKPAPNQPLKFRYQARNFRFGPGARVWLQQQARLVKADGSEVANSAGQVDHRWESLPETNEITLESSIPAPPPGKYTLEITTRDKMGKGRVQMTLPLEITP